MIDVVSAGRELDEAQRELERLEKQLSGYVEGLKGVDSSDPVLYRRG